MNYATYDQQGVITSCGRCPDGEEVNQVPPGQMLFLGEAQMSDRIDVVSGTLIKIPPPASSYRDMRRDEYPGVIAQLEALWHAMDRREIPVAIEFYSMIRAVRDKYPKPDSFTTVEF